MWLPAPLPCPPPNTPTLPSASAGSGPSTCLIPASLRISPCAAPVFAGPRRGRLALADRRPHGHGAGHHCLPPPPRRRFLCGCRRAGHCALPGLHGSHCKPLLQGGAPAAALRGASQPGPCPALPWGVLPNVVPACRARWTVQHHALTSRACGWACLTRVLLLAPDPPFPQFATKLVDTVNSMDAGAPSFGDQEGGWAAGGGADEWK